MKIIGHRLNAIKKSILSRCHICRDINPNDRLCDECRMELQRALQANPTQLDELEERYCGTKTCPMCGDACQRDEVQNGVALLCGPWGCPSCKWSEDTRFDLSTGPGSPHSIDQFGGYTPPNYFDIANT